MPSPFNFSYTPSPEYQKTHVTIGGKTWQLSSDGTQVYWRDESHGGFGAKGRLHWVPRETIDSVYNIDKARKEVDAKWSAEKVANAAGGAQMALDVAQRTGGWQSLLGRKDTTPESTTVAPGRNTLLGSTNTQGSLGSTSTLGTPQAASTPVKDSPTPNRNTLLGQVAELGKVSALGAGPAATANANPFDTSKGNLGATPKNPLDINSSIQIPKTPEELALFLKRNTLLGGKK